MTRHRPDTDTDRRYDNYWKSYCTCSSCRYRGKTQCKATIEIVNPVKGVVLQRRSTAPIDVTSATVCQGTWWDPDRWLRFKRWCSETARDMVSFGIEMLPIWIIGMFIILGLLIGYFTGRQDEHRQQQKVEHVAE